MKKATISSLKNQLSRYLRYVRAGEPVVIVDRETPIAHIIPLPSQQGAADHRLVQLEMRGIIHRGDIRQLHSFPFPVVTTPTGVLEALLTERAEGR